MKWCCIWWEKMWWTDIFVWINLTHRNVPKIWFCLQCFQRYLYLELSHPRLITACWLSDICCVTQKTQCYFCWSGEEAGHTFFPDAEYYWASDTSRTALCSPMSCYAEQKFLLASAGTPEPAWGFVSLSCLFWQHLYGVRTANQVVKCWKARMFVFREEPGVEVSDPPESEQSNGFMNQLRFFHFSDWS